MKILPHNRTDISLLYNNANFTVGYSDIAIKDVQEIRIGGGRQLKIAVINQGYESIDSATLKVFNGGINGELLKTNEMLQIAPGEEIELTYDITESSLHSIGDNAANCFYLLAETNSLESDYGNNTKEVIIYSDCAINLKAGSGGIVQGQNNYSYNSSATVTAIPNEGYVFAGWYENGKLLDALTQQYAFTVFSNRSLEAKFIPNNLKVNDIEVFGILQPGNQLTFTVETQGGEQPYEWEFYVFKGDEVCYSNNNAIANFVEWTPTESGNYTIVTYASDKSGFKVSYSKQFSIR